MKLAVVDYGMGNLRSVTKALGKVAPSARIDIARHAHQIMAADRIVVPGQGMMKACLQELRQLKLLEAVTEAARQKPFLGICIGMQMLFEYSDEGHTQGLALIPGHVRHLAQTLSASGDLLKIPHMGWNQVWPVGAHPLWAGIKPGSRFYFVHSYYVQPAQQLDIAAYCEYGPRFACAVAHGNRFAVQFHPEKSAGNGLALLANFINWQP